MKKLLCICSIFLLFYAEAATKKKSWREKDIRDMTDADLEHLLDEWEQNEEPLEPDELPEHLRPSPQIDISQLDTSNPDNILKMTKKGKGVMMFVDTNEDISAEEADVVMRIWQTSLRNNHIIAERYPIDVRRSVFLFREGSQVVDAKNFLLEQPEISHITLEGQTFYRDAKKQAKGTAEVNKKEKALNSEQRKKEKVEL